MDNFDTIIRLTYNGQGNILHVDPGSGSLYSGSVATAKYYIRFENVQFAATDLVYIAFRRPDGAESIAYQALPEAESDDIIHAFRSTGWECDIDLMAPAEVDITVHVRREISPGRYADRVTATTAVTIEPGDRFKPGQIDTSATALIQTQLADLAARQARDDIAVPQHAAQINQNTADIEQLKDEAQGAGIEQLRTDLDTETARAAAAEASLRQDLNAEVLRAQGAESGLQSAINYETAARQAGDSALQNSKVDKSAVGQANGVASLDNDGKVPLSQISDAVLGQMLHAGDWNASTAVANLTENAKVALGTTQNSITLTNNTAPITGYKANQGNFYITNTAGTFAGISFVLGDWLVANASGWGKVVNTDAVASVNGKTGPVVLIAADVGAVPDTRRVNGKALDSDINLTAIDVGAYANNVTVKDSERLGGQLPDYYAKASDVGGSGATNYDNLSNRPKINGVTLTGNKTTEELNIGVGAGSSNTKVGSGALGYLQENGSGNTAVGSDALSTENKNGSGNTAVGNGAGTYRRIQSIPGIQRIDNPNNSVYVGSYAMSGTTNPVNEIVIGSNTEGKGSNTATIGNAEVNVAYLGNKRILTVDDLGSGAGAVTMADVNNAIEAALANFSGGTGGIVRMDFAAEVNSGNYNALTVYAEGLPELDFNKVIRVELLLSYYEIEIKAPMSYYTVATEEGILQGSALAPEGLFGGLGGAPCVVSVYYQPESTIADIVEQINEIRRVS